MQLCSVVLVVEAAHVMYVTAGVAGVWACAIVFSGDGAMPGPFCWVGSCYGLMHVRCCACLCESVSMQNAAIVFSI